MTPIDQEYLELNLSVMQGEDWTRAFQMTDDNGTLIDFTGATVQWSFARGYDSDAVAKLTNGSGITVSGTTITATLSRTITKDLLGEYVHDLRIQMADGSRTFPVVGALSVRRITKDNRA